ncbi:MAG TPA: hypothetical protein VFX59_14730 [Polyangiales bacterium]|nr:hypothetical protein [Polyangiales bacterium]
MPPGIRHSPRLRCALLFGGAGCLLACDDDGQSPAPPRDAATAEHSVDAGYDAHAPLLDASRANEASAGKLVSLIEMENWRRYDAAIDPLKAHQPAEIECLESATYLEYDAFEIDTTRCNYVLAYTPALRAVPAGTELHINILHYDLLAAEPANAHLALLFGDRIQWEQTIPIPSPGNAVETSFVTSVPLAFQDPIRLHLHNHGGNTYLFVALEAPELP